MFRSHALWALVAVVFSASLMAEPQAGIKIVHPSFGVTHYEMTYEGRTVYQAEESISDHSPANVAMNVQIGDFKWGCRTTEGGVSGERNGDTSKNAAAGDYFVGCAIHRFISENATKVDLVYIGRDSTRGVDIAEHISADLKVGQLYEARTKSGSTILLLLEPRRI